MSDKKMSDKILDEMFLDIDTNRTSCLQTIRDAVSMSYVENKTDDASKTMKWFALKLKEAGGSVSMLDPEVAGKPTKAPPVLTAYFRASSSKPTLLVFAFFKSDANNIGDNAARDVFVLFGNKVTSKGSLLCLIDALRAFKLKRVELPVSVRFVVACIDDLCTPELFGFFKDKRHIIYKDVDYVCIPYSHVMDGLKPTICCGYRGCCKFEITVECARKNLHVSGNHSGMIQEALPDVIALLKSLVNSKGDVLITNIREDVREVTLEEENECRASGFDVLSLKRTAGCTTLLHKDDKKRVLMHSTRFPSVSIHGIDCGRRKTNDDIIPCKVTGKFSVRIVPDQKASLVSKRIIYHLKDVFAATRSQNKLSIEQTLAINPLLWNHKGANFQAARKSISKVLKQNVEFVREGTAYPLIADLQEVSEKDILLLPVGYYNVEKARTNREEADVETYIDGTKIAISFLFELSQFK